VPADDIPDPQDLFPQVWVNDVLKQDSNTSEMIFPLADQIAHLSRGMTLYPGDVILTGTPAGVGTGRGEFLKCGDVVRIEIERLERSATNHLAVFCGIDGDFGFESRGQALIGGGKAE